MTTDNLNENNLCRLAKAVMLKRSVGYDESLRILSGLRLHLVCDASIRSSSALQAALLTAVNCGKRAFHGGVSVSMPESASCLLPWPGMPSLNEVVRSLGGVIINQRPQSGEILLIGPDPSPAASTDLRMLATGWRGGVIPADEMIAPPTGSDFATGGIFAGALGVAKAFFRASGICVRAAHVASGVSLWNPMNGWLDSDAEGPELAYLPKQLWLLGLGHLGQAVAWNLGLLPFADSSPVTVQLQDFDRAVEANRSAGLLCESQHIGRYKTRIVSDWLEARGFSTRICERAFDALTQRQSGEPRIALCGFDSAGARRHIGDAGFDLVVECGLGSSLDDFDSFLLHTFPEASRPPQQVWPSDIESRHRILQPELVQEFHGKGECGILAETLAKKAISTSFVGASAGAWMLAELMRALHDGARMQILSQQLRSDHSVSATPHGETYVHRVTRNGFVQARCARNIPEPFHHVE
ncbi:MAG: hypothetical protein L0Z50_02550 [Verrucomicrobiales bacterium]|nr:hypothetical protein [Verrucomicrobiales bacterium]